MRVPAALHRWAAEHNRHLSAETRAEVDVIASRIDASPLGSRSILEIDAPFRASLRELFLAERAERADMLVQVVAEWAAALPAETSRTTVAEVRPRPATVRTGPLGEAELGAPAFLRSDKVDEDDSARIYGGARSYVRVILGVLSLLIVAGLGVAAWLWVSTQSEEATDAGSETPAVSDDDATDGTAGQAAVASTPSPVPTPTLEPFVTSSSRYWADLTTVLNAGSGTIVGSTYPVSPANRAVLTGHTAAITGITVSADGRVLTSGADRRLVDWGNDVTVTSPDVLDVDAPLTMLMQTTEQKLVAGDTEGNLLVIDLAAPAEPVVIAVHADAISAGGELADGRLAIASVGGSVALFSLDDPTSVTRLPHDAEVTAVAMTDGGEVATASVDGSIRLWPLTGGAPTATINTLNAPITSMIRLTDGRVAAASVDGRIHVVSPDDQADPSVVIDAHDGAIRTLLEVDDERRGPSIASGSDDSTIRLFSLTTGEQWQQLDGHGDFVSALAALPDGRLVSTSGDGTGRVWDLDLATGDIVSPPHEASLAHLAPWRNDQFVTGGVDGLVVLAGTSAPTAPETITRHNAPIVGLTVMPNGDIVSLDAASILRLNQVGTAEVNPFELQLAPGATALDDRGALGIVTGHADGSVRVSDFTSELASVAAHGSGVTAVLGLSDGRVASAGDDGTVRIIDLENPDLLPVFDLHAAPVTALAELPDGRIASSGTDGIYVWSTEDMGEEFVRFTGHRQRTVTLLGLPDGRLVSSAVDGRVRIWDLRDQGQDAETVIDVPGIVNPVVIQADNGLFVAGASRGYVVFTLE